MHESIVFCSTCTMSSYRKFSFAISSPDEFLVLLIPPILHRSEVMADYWSIFASERGVPHFNAIAGVIHCPHRHKWYSAKSYILWPSFLLQKVLVYLHHFYVIRPESNRIRWNYATVRTITLLKVIQDHRVWY